MFNKKQAKNSVEAKNAEFPSFSESVRIVKLFTILSTKFF